MEHQPYIENAIKWAREQLGSSAYSFLCLAFVENAYEEGNKIEIFGADSAKASAELYGVQRSPFAPPRGTFVFYDCSGPSPIDGVEKNWGHVGLSCGDGKVIHGWDRVREDDYLAVEQLQGAPGWTQPRYLGWTSVERILQGHRKQVK
jgi:cell wall-associated NlpC family hydrolase